MDYVIPPINSKGKFELATPFDNILSPLEEYTVTAVRSINEIMPDDPLNNIYIPVGLDSDDLTSDVNNGVPIVVLVSTGGEYIYVPGDKFTTIPLVNGVRHQELLLTIPLGLLPENMDLNVLKTNIQDTVYAVVGNKGISTIIENSAIVLLDETETKRLRLLRENAITVTKSDKVKYEETLELLKSKEKQLKGLEAYIKKNKSN